MSDPDLTPERDDVTTENEEGLSTAFRWTAVAVVAATVFVTIFVVLAIALPDKSKTTTREPLPLPSASPTQFPIPPGLQKFDNKFLSDGTPQGDAQSAFTSAVGSALPSGTEDITGAVMADMNQKGVQGFWYNAGEKDLKAYMSSAMKNLPDGWTLAADVQCTDLKGPTFIQPPVGNAFFSISSKGAQVCSSLAYNGEETVTYMGVMLTSEAGTPGDYTGNPAKGLGYVDIPQDGVIVFAAPESSVTSNETPFPELPASSSASPSPSGS